MIHWYGVRVPGCTPVPETTKPLPADRDGQCTIGGRDGASGGCRAPSARGAPVRGGQGEVQVVVPVAPADPLTLAMKPTETEAFGAGFAV
jgi:hypothetical protein